HYTYASVSCYVSAPPPPAISSLSLHDALPICEIDNLLECVSTYVHEVASLNAANVSCLRTAAELALLAGEEQRAKDLRAEADELVGQVLELYADGAGHFRARRPDGAFVPVRHCYDFSTVGLTIPDDLSETQ